jgi:outer membrane immunogenic protein
MKAIKMLAGAAALAFTATPALAADFSGFRIGANVGYADEGAEDAVTYAVNAGYDFQTNGAVIGITAELGDSNETGRDLALSGRVGGVVGERVLIYGHGGYTNLNAGGFNFEGIRGGAGVEFAVSDNAYINAEYRYSNYDSCLDFHGVVAGFGFRF